MSREYWIQGMYYQSNTKAFDFVLVVMDKILGNYSDTSEIHKGLERIKKTSYSI